MWSAFLSGSNEQVFDTCLTSCCYKATLLDQSSFADCHDPFCSSFTWRNATVPLLRRSDRGFIEPLSVLPRGDPGRSHCRASLQEGRPRADAARPSVYSTCGDSSLFCRWVQRLSASGSRSCLRHSVLDSIAIPGGRRTRSLWRLPLHSELRR